MIKNQKVVCTAPETGELKKNGEPKKLFIRLGVRINMENGEWFFFKFSSAFKEAKSDHERDRPDLFVMEDGFHAGKKGYWSRPSGWTRHTPGVAQMTKSGKDAVESTLNGFKVVYSKETIDRFGSHATKADSLLRESMGHARIGGKSLVDALIEARELALLQEAEERAARRAA